MRKTKLTFQIDNINDYTNIFENTLQTLNLDFTKKWLKKESVVILLSVVEKKM